MKFLLLLSLLQACWSLGRRDVLKMEILELSRKTERGLNETPEERDRMLSLFTQLEKLNSERKTVSSPRLNGTWALEYTTSDRILGRNGKGSLFQGGRAKVGKVLQLIGTR